MPETSRYSRPRPALSCLSATILFAISAPSGHAAALIDMGSGQRIALKGDYQATSMGYAALGAHDGGIITGSGVSLSSQFDALFRAAGSGSRIVLDDVKLGSSFGAQGYVEDGATVALNRAEFTSGDVIYVGGTGSQLAVRNSRSQPVSTAFDIRSAGDLVLDNVTLEGTPSGSGAAMIRASGDPTVSIIGASNLTTHDNAVLKLSDGAKAALRNSTLSTSPTRPENMGYYPVVQLNEGTALDADDVTLTFDKEGSALSMGDSTTADVRNSRIIGTNIADAGAAVDAFGTGSRAALSNVRIDISGDLSPAPGTFMGAYAGRGAALTMQDSSIVTDGQGLTGLRADAGDVYLNATTISTKQADSGGVELNSASGRMTGGGVSAMGAGSPALVMSAGGMFSVSDATLSAADAQAIRLSGGPVQLTLDNSQVTGESGLALTMQDADRPAAAGACIVAGLRNGSVMNGDVTATGSRAASTFAVNLNGATLNGAVNGTGGSTALTTLNGGVWSLSGNSTLDTLSNGGTVAFAGGAAGTGLHVRGDYQGNNGLIAFRTVLGDDRSVTDHMTVDGSTAGKTNVTVANAGGSGAKTLEGIELIHVGGSSGGEFTQQGRIAAGAWDYRLVRGEGDNAGNWYLTSQQAEPPAPPDNGGDKPDSGGDRPDSGGDKPDSGGDKPDSGGDRPDSGGGKPDSGGGKPDSGGDRPDSGGGKPDSGGGKPDSGGGKPDSGGGKPVPVREGSVRPEPGSYTANLAAANTLFVTRLHDRLGETQYTDALTGEHKVTSMWMRQVGGHNAWRDGSGQLKTRSNRYVIQIGGDIARWSGDGPDRWHLGVMAGYGHNSSNTRSSSTGYSSGGSVNGYSGGMYATWYANDETHQGAYLDSWAQYSWFNNRVKGQDIQSESYRSKGLTGSLELGYTHRLGEFNGSKGTLNEWYIQPQAQAVWMGVKADGHREANGTLISGEGDGNVQTRLGVRTFLKSHSAIDHGKGREFEPFVEVNWLHNTRDFGARMDGVSIRQAGARNLGEIKTGVEGQLDPELNLWGNVGVRMGDKGYNDAAAMVGIKYSFK